MAAKLARFAWQLQPTNHLADFVPHYVHSCTARDHAQLVISVKVAKSTGCPDCGLKPGEKS